MMGYTSRVSSSVDCIIAFSITGRASDMHFIMADIFIPILVADTSRTSAGLEGTAEADPSACPSAPHIGRRNWERLASCQGALPNTYFTELPGVIAKPAIGGTVSPNAV